jgi:hypothetical protein
MPPWRMWMCAWWTNRSTIASTATAFPKTSGQVEKSLVEETMREASS